MSLKPLKVLAAGGTLNTLQGGRFGHGFLSAGVTKAFSPAIQNNIGNVYGQGAAAAILGGTMSRISGGKFANGAVTAAMAYAFNQLMSDRRFDTFEEALDHQLEETKARHDALNRSRSTRTQRSGVPRFQSEYSSEPIGGFIVEERRTLWPLRLWRTGYFRVSRSLTPGHAWGQVDSYAAGAASDVAALAVYTDPSADVGRPNFFDVSRRIGAPVFVQQPSGTIYRYTSTGCSVYRGGVSSC